ncbi:MAG: hypothetical protein IGR80_16980 [Synechococcales cyanobacterium K44_A2020_017]|nr:hypothetical protein [Synechococcales cyanobacterium K32_A2020_035]MBF2096432.1 hypothetical protein [Synechococcales cyanobacterium K44_A2020_017]
MVNYSPGAIALHNRQSMKLLSSLLHKHQQRRSLILACCNDVRWHGAIIRKLRAHCALPLQAVKLPASTRSLYGELHSQGMTYPANGALMILGLDAIAALNRVLLAFELEYQTYPDTPPVPLVLWVTDRVMSKISQFAPLLEEQASDPVRFWAIASAEPPAAIAPSSPPLESCCAGEM